MEQLIAAFVAALPGLITTVIPSIIKAYDSAPTKGALAAAQAVANSLPPATQQLLKQIGAAWFPKLSPELHVVAGALLGHQNNTSYAQAVLNIAHLSGWLSWKLPNGKDTLAQDGVLGKNTFAAIEAFQAKIGLPVNGFIGTLEYMALQKLDAGVAAA